MENNDSPCFKSTANIEVTSAFNDSFNKHDHSTTISSYRIDTHDNRKVFVLFNIPTEFLMAPSQIRGACKPITSKKQILAIDGVIN